MYHNNAEMNTKGKRGFNTINGLRFYQCL